MSIQVNSAEITDEEKKFIEIFYGRTFRSKVHHGDEAILEYVAEKIFGDKGYRGRVKNLVLDLKIKGYMEVTTQKFHMRETIKGSELYRILKSQNLPTVSKNETS